MARMCVCFLPLSGFSLASVVVLLRCPLTDTVQHFLVPPVLVGDTKTSISTFPKALEIGKAYVKGQRLTLWS